MNKLFGENVTRNTAALVVMWLIAVLVAATVQWRMLRYLAIVMIAGAVIYFTLAVVYSLIGNRENNKGNTESK